MISDIQELLQRFSSLKKEEEIVTSNNTENIKELLKRFSPFVEQLKESHRIETPHYNIFKVLRIEYLEASVHTPFLADLLNPKGKHSQGNLFFDAFLEMIVGDNELFKNYNAENIEVKAEYFTAKGIIDILILYRHPNKVKRFAIIIENKIFATDQENQLKRYYDYARYDLKFSDEQIKMVYLKPIKEPPSSFSIEETDYINLIQKGIFKLLGYSPDIIKMLLLCNDKIMSEKLKQTIFQYIEVLKEFDYAKN